MAIASCAGSSLCRARVDSAMPSFKVNELQVQFARVVRSGSKSSRGRSLIINSSDPGSGSCCGGNGHSGGGGCSSHKSPSPDLAGVGKQFEAMVAASQMREFEKEYTTGELEGSISREIVQDVINILPEALVKSKEEKFLNVDQILAEARLMSSDNFVFEDDLEGMMV